MSYSFKQRKGVTIVNAFQKILDDSKRKPNKIWVDTGSQFYNLEKNDIKMYSTHNEGKLIVAERFTRPLKNKIFKDMTAVSKNVYIDKLSDKGNEYNNADHRTIKIKPLDVKDNTYVDFRKEVHVKDPKFKVGDHARLSKYKNISAKGYIPNWSEEVFVINEVKNTIPWIFVISDFNGEKLLEHFVKKICKTEIKKNLG